MNEPFSPGKTEAGIWTIAGAKETNLNRRCQTLYEKAKSVAESRLKRGDIAAKERLENALEFAFQPFLRENLILADQISSPEYVQFAKKVENYLDASVGFIFCVDGRLYILSFGVPKAEKFTRRPSGMPLTRESTKDGTPVLDDPNLSASAISEMRERREDGKSLRQVEFVTYHIDSEHPEHGCGAETNFAKEKGHSVEVAMRHGRIREWFKRLGKHFESFDTNAKRAGGEGVSFDLVHDSHTDGLIAGLKAIEEFDETKSLKENLDDLSSRGLILRTEDLDSVFANQIYLEAAQMGGAKLNLKNPYDFTKNVSTIGTIAMKLTSKAEEEGFSFIPDVIKSNKPSYAIKVLAFTAIFNTVYRTLGEIRKGDHELQEHPEKLVTVGPIGAYANRENVAFLHQTDDSELDPKDIITTKFLHGLNADVARKSAKKGKGLGLEKQGRIIIATGRINPDIYKDDRSKKRELDKVIAYVKNNAAKLREELEPSVKTGETIIFGAIFNEASREIIEIC
jgi:hypothetical protein